MGQQVLSGFRPQDNYSRDLVSQIDVAERDKVQTPVHCAATSIRVERQKRSICAVLANVPGYLEFKTHTTRLNHFLIGGYTSIVQPKSQPAQARNAAEKWFGWIVLGLRRVVCFPLRPPLD